MINNLGKGPRTCLLERVEYACQLLLLVFTSHVQILVTENVRGKNDLMLLSTCSYSRKTWRFLSFLRLGWLASLCRKTWKQLILDICTYVFLKGSETSCWATVFLNVARYSASNSWIVYLNCKNCLEGIFFLLHRLSFVLPASSCWTLLLSIALTPLRPVSESNFS